MFILQLDTAFAHSTQLQLIKSLTFSLLSSNLNSILENQNQRQLKIQNKHLTQHQHFRSTFPLSQQRKRKEKPILQRQQGTKERSISRSALKMARAPFTSFPFVLIILLSIVHLSHCKTLKRDVKALNEIKASLGWRVVYAWVGDDPCGDGDLPPWSGVTCSTVGDYRVVTELEVYAVSIVGPFPTAVTSLLDLTRLDLHNNKLTGPIPPQIGRLKRLKILNLRWNKLQDAIPPEIGELKSLTHLYLSFNNFKGEIPKELANLPDLRYLYLHENRLAGRIPPELGTLQNLRHLDAGNNHLVGTIRELIRIEGCFPALRNLYLNNNYFTGGIPAQLANLTSLEILYLSYNKMSGVIPSTVAHIPKLTYLYLDHNQFSGRIPEPFYKHPFLKEM
ncbi:putative leucine-rich repeat receptor-like protein kinase isoform B [Glycine soja]|nr:putative leucine-rich repeat receptor-like protein kinase isoform B [Glycine soja]